MNDFIKFVQEFWFQIAAGLAFVVECLFIFIKRKPKSIDDFELALENALSFIPELVTKVERPGEGASKKSEVLSICLNLIKHKLNRHLTDYEVSMVDNLVSDKIEVVLSSPKKKEIIDEK